MKKESRQRYAFDEFELDLESQMLLCRDVPVPLKPKVFDLLCILVENAGRLVSKQELVDALWPEVFVEEANLTQSIYELRRALSQGEQRQIIANVPRRGYRLDATVVRQPSRAAVSERSGRTETMAVLPFSALSPNESDPSLELGIAETLITGLSRLDRLIVRPTGSIHRYTGDVPDAVDAGRELNVETVLAGTIQRAGDRIRVTARLIRARDGAVLWSGKFDELFTGIFSVQDSICDRVVEALSLELPVGSRALVQRHTEDAEVHRLFLECRYHWHKWTPENWRRAIECGQRVVDIDPGHAPAYSWMAASHTALAITGVVPPGGAFREARHLVDQALAIDETLSEAHEVRGAIELFHEWRWDEAERALNRSIELNPRNAGARDLRALLLIVTGKPSEAIDEVLIARELDPLSLLINTDVGNVHYYARRFEDSISYLEHVLSLDPWFAHARYGLAYGCLQTGDRTRAIREMNAAIEYFGRDRDTSADLAYALAVSGERAEAQRILGALIDQSTSSFVDPYFPALIHVGLDQKDEAFEWLEKAFRARSRELIYLRADPVFDTLRSDRRLGDLMDRVGV